MDFQGPCIYPEVLFAFAYDFCDQMGFPADSSHILSFRGFLAVVLYLGNKHLAIWPALVLLLCVITINVHVLQRL